MNDADSPSQKDSAVEMKDKVVDQKDSVVEMELENKPNEQNGTDNEHDPKNIKEEEREAHTDEEDKKDDDGKAKESSTMATTEESTIHKIRNNNSSNSEGDEHTAESKTTTEAMGIDNSNRQQQNGHEEHSISVTQEEVEHKKSEEERGGETANNTDPMEEAQDSAVGGGDGKLDAGEAVAKGESQRPPEAHPPHPHPLPQWPPPPDECLPIILDVLREAHKRYLTCLLLSSRSWTVQVDADVFDRFYALHDSRRPCDVKDIITDMKREVLAGCFVVFSGFYPREVDPRMYVCLTSFYLSFFFLLDSF